MSLLLRIVKIIVTLFVYLIAQTFVAASINSFFDLIPMKIDNLFDIHSYKILYPVLSGSSSDDDRETATRESTGKIDLTDGSRVGEFKNSLKMVSNEL